MSEPTSEEKHAAARAALEAMNPPVTETGIADLTVDMVVAIVWSQMPLMPQAVPPDAVPIAGPMLLEVLRAPTPELEAKVAAHNKQGVALAEEIRHADG